MGEDTGILGHTKQWQTFDWPEIDAGGSYVYPFSVLIYLFQYNA
jgi:hypothetical protein